MSISLKIQCNKANKKTRQRTSGEQRFKVQEYMSGELWTSICQWT